MRTWRENNATQPSEKNNVMGKTCHTKMQQSKELSKSMKKNGANANNAVCVRYVLMNSKT